MNELELQKIVYEIYTMPNRENFLNKYTIDEQNKIRNALSQLEIEVERLIEDNYINRRITI